MTSTPGIRIVALLLLLIGVVLAPRAMAQACTVSSTNVAFGDYNPTSPTPLTATGAIRVNCMGNKAITITLTPGYGTYASRYMKSASAAAGFLYYNLYLDSARTIVFGDGTGGSSIASCNAGSPPSNGGECVGTNPSGSERLATQPVFGRINASQDVGAGDFSDNLTYTVTF